MSLLADDPINWSDQTILVVCIGAGVLVVNVVCWLTLFFLRSGSRSLSAPDTLARLLRGGLAEALGVFALVFVGVLVCVAGPIAGGPNPGLLAIALAHGLTITVMATAVGHISGGHFNPAVTLGLVLAGRFRLDQAVCWVLGQTVGALVAAGLLSGLFGTSALVAAVPTPGAELPLRTAFVLEAVATFFLVLVVFGTAIDARGPIRLAPVAIGLTMSVGLLAIGPLTGGALNPARFIAPALVCGQLSHWPVYLAGPCVGAAVAATLMQFFLIEETPAEEEPPVVLIATPVQTEQRQAA